MLKTVEFLRGNATLVVGPSGLVICDGFDISLTTADELHALLQTGGTAKSLFLRLIGLHAQRVELAARTNSAEVPEVIACVDEVDRVALMSLSGSSLVVVTENSTTTIDPADRSFVMERVIPGRLLRCDIGLMDDTGFRFHSFGGVLPVSACSVKFGPAVGSAEVALAPVVVAPLVGAPVVVAPVVVAPVVVAPVVVAPVVVAVEPDPEPEEDAGEQFDEPFDEYDPDPDSDDDLEFDSDEPDPGELDPDAIYDEEDDSLTVWPARSAAAPIAAPAPVALPASAPVAVSLGPAVISPTTAELLDSQHTYDSQHIYDEIPAPRVERADDAWQPPEWQPSSGPSVANSGQSPVAVTAQNAEPIVTWSPPGEPVAPIDEADLTLVEQGSPVVNKVSFIAPMATSEEVVGTFCANNHFTDSRRLRCLFCDAETQFDRVDTGQRPMLGRLRFDDGRIIELQRNVLIGRKPTAPEGVIADVIEIDDDRLLSRLHVEVRLIDWDVVVVDRQSANGTSIVHPDGRRVATRANVDAPLESGSTVHFGRHHFVFEGPVFEGPGSP